MGETISDVDFSSAVMRKVDQIQTIPHQDVEQAAQDVIRAAVAARGREIVENISHYNYTSRRYALDDTATGGTYMPTDDGRYIYTSTGEVMAGDPRQIDPGQYQWIIEEFRYFHERWPSFPRTMAEHCEDAKKTIQSGRMTPILGVSETVASNWSGTASDNFHDYFLAPFVMRAVTNQQALLDELAVAMYGYEALLKQARVVAMDIATQSTNALDSLMPEAAGISGEQALGMAGVVIGVVTAVATGGTAVGVSLGLIGAGLSLVGMLAASPRIGGDTVDEVLQSLRTTLDQRHQEMDDVEESIATALGKTDAEVAKHLDGSPLDVGTVLPNEPDADGVPNLTAGELPGTGENGFRPRQ
jgi:hypothetical protein